MVEEHTAMDEEMARKGRDEDFEVRNRLAGNLGQNRSLSHPPHTACHGKFWVKQ
jgi:hypothetical protein